MSTGFHKGVIVKAAATGICFVIGLLLAASEGVWWPWINMAGIGIFAMVPVLANKGGVR